MRALIVDDSRFIREFLGGLLGGLKIESDHAANGREALDLLLGGAKFDFALVDINMPTMNGLELVRAMREQEAFNHIKLMMVTTEADKTIVSTALRLGADEFLMKPFSEERLIEKLWQMGVMEH